MTTITPERLRLLHGTDAPLANMRLLHAGPATLLLDGVDLRYLRLGSIELVRRVYAAVRDRDWDTVPGAVSGVEVTDSDDGFRVEFDVRHARREVDFSWHGTIKVDGLPFDDHPNNEPHPGCIFWVHYWGFDARDVVATFRAHPPTGHGEFLLSDTVSLPGPQQTVSGSYDLAPIFESLGIAPHPNQGFHVKLQVTSTDGRNLTKHKVFWINCPAPAAEVIGEEIEVEQPGRPGVDVIGEEVTGEEEGVDVEERRALPPEEVLGIVHERPEVLGAQVAAAPEEEEARPGVLPVTGASLLIFLLAGLALIGAGANLYRARRR